MTIILNSAAHQTPGWLTVGKHADEKAQSPWPYLTDLPLATQGPLPSTAYSASSLGPRGTLGPGLGPCLPSGKEEKMGKDRLGP